MATFSIRKNKTHSSAESQSSVSFILTPKCSWHQVAPPKLCLHTKTGNTSWLRKRPISIITASSAKPKRCEGNLLSYIPTDIFSISLETSGNFFPGQRRQLVTITQSYGKPLGCRERQRSLLMPVKQQSFGYSLKTTQDRRKGLKKLVVTGLIHKALESKKVPVLKCLTGAQFYSQTYPKSHIMQQGSSSLEH